MLAVRTHQAKVHRLGSGVGALQTDACLPYVCRVMSEKYTDLFKQQAVHQALRCCPLTREHTAATLGIDAETLREWLAELAMEKLDEQAFKIRRGICPATEDLELQITKLRAELSDESFVADNLRNENAKLMAENRDMQAVIRQNKQLKAYARALVRQNDDLQDIIGMHVGVHIDSDD